MNLQKIILEGLLDWLCITRDDHEEKHPFSTIYKRLRYDHKFVLQVARYVIFRTLSDWIGWDRRVACDRPLCRIGSKLHIRFRLRRENGSVKNIGHSNDLNDNMEWYPERSQSSFHGVWNWTCSLDIIQQYWYCRMHSVLTTGCTGTVWCCRRDRCYIFTHTVQPLRETSVHWFTISLDVAWFCVHFAFQKTT